MTSKLPPILNKLLERVKDGNSYLNLIVQSGGVFVYQILGLAASYMLQIFLGRWMGASGLGNFNYAFTWGRLIAIIGDLGFGLSVMKFAPEYRAQEDWRKLKGALIAFTGISIVSCTIVALLMIALFNTFPPQDIALMTLFAGLLITPLIALKDLYVQTLRALDFITLAYLPAQVLMHLMTLGACGAILLLDGSLSSLQAIFALALSIVVVLTMQFMSIVHALNDTLGKVKPEYHLGYWVRESVPMILIRGTIEIMNRADIIMVGLFLGSFDTGIYSVAARMASLVGFGLYAVNGIIVPRIAPLYKTGKMDDLQRMVRQASQLSFLAGGGLFLGITLLAPFLLGVFGEEFVIGRTALVLLSLAYFINSGLGAVGPLMHLTEFQGTSVRIHLVSLGVNIGLNSLLIPMFGIEGAAIATASAALFQKIWTYFAVRQAMGIDTLPFKLF